MLAACGVQALSTAGRVWSAELTRVRVSRRLRSPAKREKQAGS